MNFIQFPALLLWLFLPVCAWSQTAPLVVEAEILHISTSSTFHLDIQHVRTGQSSPGSVHATLMEGSENLARGLRRFQSQKWLITLYLIDDKYLIQSAFGLGSINGGDSHNPFPEPHLLPNHEEQQRPPHKSHGRNLSGHGTPEEQVVELTNIERYENGMLPPLKGNDLLHCAADGHSDRQAVADFFAHCDLHLNLSPWQRMHNVQYYYNAAAENIHGNSSSAASAVAGWMGSPPHRANILSSSYREIGTGYNADGDTDNTYADNGNCDPGTNYGNINHYWTQKFGRRNSVYPMVIEREKIEVSSQSVELYVYAPSSTNRMRFRNENGTWSSWIPYTPNHTWTLSSGNGTKTVYAETCIGQGCNTANYSASDQIELNGNCELMTFSNENLNENQTYTYCEIIADPNVTISAQIIFQATEVTLGSGFEIPLGASLQVDIQ